MELNLLPISEYQKRFFLEWVLNPNSSEYNVSMVSKINGNLHKEQLKQACNILIQEHKIVHARYNLDGSECYNGNYTIDDFYEEVFLNKDGNLNSSIKDLLEKPFDLTNGPCCKFYLLNTADDTNYFIVNIHHIICDATTGALILNQLGEYYNNLVTNKINLPSTIKNFSDAVYLEQNELAKKNIIATKDFWQRLLNDAPLTVNTLPRNFEQKKQQIDFYLNQEELLGFKNVIKESKSTPFVLLAALFGLTISKYYNQEQFAISYPINMRPKGFAKVLGCFINNIPLVINSYFHLKLYDFIQDIMQQRILGMEHVWYSLTNIVQDQRQIRNDGWQNYFNIGIIETKLGIPAMPIEGVTIEAEEIILEQTGIYDISLTYDPYTISTLGVRFKLEYKESIVDESMANNFILALKRLIVNCYEYKNHNLGDINLLSESDYTRIVYAWNETRRSYPSSKLSHHLFEEQVLKTPNNIALIYEGVKLTYQELNERSNQLSYYLQTSYTIKGDDLIALCVDRNEHLLMAILGVLKSGGAYVPIDSGYPEERISYILRDIKCRVILTNIAHTEKLNNIIRDTSINVSDKDSINSSICCIDESAFITTLKTYPVANLSQNISVQNLAYVIYTSGTTGNPKGVMIEHSQLSNFIYGFRDKLLLEGISSLNMLSSTNYVFDIFGLEYMLPLSEGYSVELINNSMFLEQSCKLKLSQYDCIQLTPSKVSLLFAQIEAEQLDSVHEVTLLIGGEALNKNDIKQIRNYELEHNNIKFNIINVYGPTETTIWSTMSILKNYTINIGKPLYNETTYILDNSLQPLPLGSIGELYIGGLGVARGYLNQPELTKEKFLPNPFQSEEEKSLDLNSRLYKTGDLVRYLSDGKIEYMGRNDDQVKMRGFRVELNEIENKLLSYTGVKKAVVIAHNSNSVQTKDHSMTSESSRNNIYLVGYYVSETKLIESKILNYLSSKLPDYMVPSTLIWLDKLPLTVNGKLDRKSLPNPEVMVKDTYVAPRNELEEKMCKMFAQILNVTIKSVGLKSDFFRLGGNSILAIKLVNLINNEYKAHVKVADLFVGKTPSGLIMNVIQTKEGFQLIVKLNTTIDKPNMFMIHPMIAGCEVYTSIAVSLLDYYSCYGIDNYNLHHSDDKKITELRSLARYYLDHIEQMMQKTNQSRYILLGWSLGGRIALEIANILEEEGKRDIIVILLDTVIPSEQAIFDSNTNNTARKLDRNIEFNLKLRYGREYASKVLSNFTVELKMCDSTLFYKLKYTQIYLFKSLRFQPFLIDNELEKKSSSMYDNNISSICTDSKLLSIISVENANHFDLIEQTDLFLPVLIKILET